MLFWDWIFAIFFTLVGIVVLIAGIWGLYNRIVTRHHFRSTDAGYFLSTFLIVLGMVVALFSAVVVPAEFSEQRTDNNLFHEWCAEQGGTVLDITNQPYECWKTKIGQN